MSFEIVEIRPWDRDRFWEAVVLDSKGHHRYSYWMKDQYPDELSVYMALHNYTEDSIKQQRKKPI